MQTRIAGARKGDDLYLIPAEGDPLPPVGTAVRGGLDDARRTALMRTHSGLHVLCGGFSATTVPRSPAGTWNRCRHAWTSTCPIENNGKGFRRLRIRISD